MMAPRVIRVIAMIVCLAVGIPGMIVSSITDHDGAAVTFGLVAAVASLCLIVVSAVTRQSDRTALVDRTGQGFDERQAAAVEDRIRELTDQGADEAVVRDLVRAAVQLGRARPH